MVYTDDLVGKEAKILLEKVSARLAEKWEKPYSEVRVVNAGMSMPSPELPTSVSVDSRILKSKMCNFLPQCEDQAGLGVFRR